MTGDPELSDRAPKDDTSALLRSISERPPSDAPYLSASTARYIVESSQSNIKEKPKERKVEDVFSDLPLRITRLLYDIAILSRGDYIDDLDKNWESMEQMPDFVSYTTRHSHGRETTSGRGNFQFNLGFDIGLGLSALTGTLSEDSRASEFLAGFTTAYSTDDFQRPHTPDKGTMNNEMDQEREQLLTQYGVEPTRYIDQLIQNYNIGWRKAQGKEPLPTKQATQEYLEEQVDEWFGICSHVRKELDNEWASINEASTPGMSAEAALRALWELENEPSSDGVNSSAIARRAGKSDSHKGTVSQVLNRLSIDGKNPATGVMSVFEAAEIVRYNGGGWVLTGYGQLLLYHVFVKNQDPQWIQENAIKAGLPSDEGQRWSDKASEILRQGVSHYSNN